MPRTKAPRADKVEVVGELQDIFSKSSALFMTEYRGLTVAEISELRKRIRPPGGQYHVVKNKLFRRAMGSEINPELETLLAGPTAIAFATGDSVDTAKILIQFLKEIRKPEIKLKGGYVDGRIYSVDQVTALSKIPPREVVLATAIGTMQAPLTNFAGTLNGILGEFARTLQAAVDKKTAEGA